MNTLFHFRLFVIINIAIINSAAKVILFSLRATLLQEYFSPYILLLYIESIVLDYFSYFLLLNKKKNTTFALILWCRRIATDV